jgi:hypothetical protein
VLLLRENAIAHKIHTHYFLILSTSCGKNIKEKKTKKKQKDEKKKNIESMRERRREKAREGDSAG